MKRRNIIQRHAHNVFFYVLLLLYRYIIIISLFCFTGNKKLKKIKNVFFKQQQQQTISQVNNIRKRNERDILMSHCTYTLYINTGDIIRYKV